MTFSTSPAAPIPSTTRAVGYTTNRPATHPEALVERDIAVPIMGPHDVLVEVEAVSVNPVDVKLRAGAPTDSLRVLGFDAAGTVRAVGNQVRLFAAGDEVYYAGALDRPGSNQRLHVVDERLVARKPATLSFADAAALPLTSLTAWESLVDRLGVTDRSTGTLLVVGATGGVGSVLLQLVRALMPGVQVMATAAGPADGERATWVRDLGATYVVDHHGDLATQVLDIAPDGVDWVFTAHSHDQVDLYAQVVRPFGHIVAIDDGPRDIEPLKAKSIAWHWELMFTRALHQTPDMIEQHHILDRVADLVDTGAMRSTRTTTLTPINASTLREAHALVEGGHTLGKVVVAGW